MIRVQVVQRTTKANLCRRAGRSLRVTALHASISPHDRTSAYDAHQLIPKPPPPDVAAYPSPEATFEYVLCIPFICAGQPPLSSC